MLKYVDKPRAFTVYRDMQNTSGAICYICYLLHCYSKYSLELTFIRSQDFFGWPNSGWIIFRGCFVLADFKCYISLNDNENIKPLSSRKHIYSVCKGT